MSPCKEDAFNPKDEAVDLQEPINVTDFASKLMKTRYVERTRPDISLALSILQKEMRAPTKSSDKRLQHALSYLNSTKNLGIHLKPNISLKICAYIDAAYAVHKKRQSHTGMIFTMGEFGPAIMWKSTVQKVVSNSSTEAELIAIHDSLDFLLWIKRVMQWLGEPQGVTTIFQDNTSTITMAYLGRGSSNSKTRHIDIKYFWITQFADNKEVELDHLPRESMIADILASPRTGSSFRHMRDLVLGRIT
jgi:hypothetical protein